MAEPRKKAARPCRFLCICQGGNVRSVALAYVLKYGHGQDALAASAEANTPETLGMLCRWADHVIVMAQDVMPFLGDKAKGAQLKMVDVGPDVFGSAFHPALQAMLQPVVAEWAARGWRL